MGEVTKLRNSNPLVNVLTADVWELINDDKFGGMSVAEVVGVFEFVQNDLINGNWYGQ